MGYREPPKLFETNPYSNEKWKIAKEKALKRDNYKCKCGKPATIPHHIIPVEKLNNIEEFTDIDNVISLCKSCHGKIHYPPIIKRGKEKIKNKIKKGYDNYFMFLY